MDRFKITLVLLIFRTLSGTSGQLSFVTVREHQVALLSCENVSGGEPGCNQTDWMYLEQSRSTELYIRGQKTVAMLGATLSDNCSLLIQGVSEEQVGYYSCQHHGEYHGNVADSVLSVIIVREHRDGSSVTLSCSVRSVEFCRYSVKWTLNGEDLPKDHLKMSYSDSTANVSFTDPDLYQRFNQSLKCEATNHIIKGQQSTTLSWSTVKSTDVATPMPTTISETSIDITASPTMSSTIKGLMLRHVVVSVALAVLLMCVSVVFICTRTKVSEIKTKRSLDKVIFCKTVSTEVDSHDSSDIYENMGEPSIVISLNKSTS